MSKKVLIIYPGSLYSGEWKFYKDFRPQLLILYSFLKEHGIDAEVLDLECEIGALKDTLTLEAYEACVEQLLREYNFDVAAISCYASINYLDSMMTARLCRKINPSAQIVVGGYHPTAVPTDFLEEGLFDYIVQGEGENALLEIAREHGNGHGGSQVVEGVPRDTSRGVYLDWEGYKYTRNIKYRYAGLTFARTCPFKCTYCAESTSAYRVQNYSVSYALRDLERAISAVQPEFFCFYDPLFRVNTPWAREFLSALVERFPQKPVFRPLTRIDLINKEDIDLLSRLNIHLFFGVETCSPAMLTLMDKTKNPQLYLEKTRENLRYISEKDIISDVSLILNHPGETEATVDETIRFFEETFSGFDQIPIFFNISNFIYLPGTLVAEKLDYLHKEFGTVVKHKTWWREPYNQIDLAREIVANAKEPDKVNWTEKMGKFLATKKITEKALFHRLRFDIVHKFDEGEVLSLSQP